ncbi:MAG: DUF4263 domain-containing protein [Proteobacteria bacterium]|nr:DUF4263 domain-containing protein [Pseudomonadota bacterium]
MEPEKIGFSAEDQFAVIDTWCPTRLFPHPFTIANLASAMALSDETWQFLWDFRSGPAYNDVIDAYEEAALITPDSRIKTILAPAELNHPSADIDDLAMRTQSRVLRLKPKKLPFTSFDLAAFNEEYAWSVDYPTFVKDHMPTSGIGLYQDYGIEIGKRQYKDHVDSIIEETEGFHWEMYQATKEHRADLLGRFLGKIAENSILAELAMISFEDKIFAVPYHTNSLHYVPCRKESEAILIQPGRASAQYWKRFHADILNLERVINQPCVYERDVESVLRANPLFLRSLNYSEIYPQVILPRENASDLRPDIIAKPVNSEWCDIIDLKLPTTRIMVGRDNRKSLAAAITEAVAQLREYRAYFDESRVARIVEQRYGFKCYQPKMVVIVGRDATMYDDAQTRRALTAYPDLEIVTYDMLLQAARSLLLL